MTLKLPHPEENFINELRALGKGSLFIDVGSHVGWYTVNIADLYDEVWAIEPYHMYADGLRENLKKFNIINVKVIEKAISDKAETMTFYGNNYALSGQDCPSLKRDLILSYEGRNKTLPLTLGTVETATLASLIGNRQVDLIKVDAESSEKDVLQGARSIINQVKAWHVEVHDWSEIDEITKFLEFYGYNVTERGLDGRAKGWLLAQK